MYTNNNTSPASSRIHTPDLRPHANNKHETLSKASGSLFATRSKDESDEAAVQNGRGGRERLTSVASSFLSMCSSSAMVTVVFFTPSSPGGAAAGNLDEEQDARGGSDRAGWKREMRVEG